MILVRPAREYLARYVAALERRWSPDNSRPEVAGEQLQRIKADPEAIDSLFDPMRRDERFNRILRNVCR